jgi:hypothetical protein
MFVLQLLRYTLRLFHLDLFDCAIQRVIGFAAFRGATHVSGSVRKRDARFRHADKFNGLLCRDRELQRFWIGKTDVFAGKNHDAPRDESEVFAGM